MAVPEDLSFVSPPTDLNFKNIVEFEFHVFI